MDRKREGVFQIASYVCSHYCLLPCKFNDINFTEVDIKIYKKRVEQVFMKNHGLKRVIISNND